MAEGNDLAKKQWLYMMSALGGGLLIGAAVGAFVVAPYLSKAKAKKAAETPKA